MPTFIVPQINYYLYSLNKMGYLRNCLSWKHVMDCTEFLVNGIS